MYFSSISARAGLDVGGAIDRAIGAAEQEREHGSHARILGRTAAIRVSRLRGSSGGPGRRIPIRTNPRTREPANREPTMLLMRIDHQRLVLTASRLGHGRRGVRPLGSAAAGVPDQPRRRMGAPAPRADRRHRRLHRGRPPQGLLRRLEQPGLVHEPRRASLPPQLAPADVRRIHPRGSRAVHRLEHASRRASRSPRSAPRSAPITPPTRCCAIPIA